MELIKPNIEHKKEYEKLILEWKQVENIVWMPPKALFEWDNFDDFLDIIEKRAKWEWYKVPAQLFFWVDNWEIIWAIDIRFHINHPVLIKNWWHIGYWVAPKYRNKWYATQMLSLALQECKKIGLEKVLLTCDINFIASSKVIQKNWWIYEDTIDYKWSKNHRYWIHL